MKPISILMSALAFSACTQAERSAAGNEASLEEVETIEPTPTAAVVPEADLSPDEKEMLSQARAAKQELGKRLMGTLKAAVQEGDFERGVEVCKTAAPSLTQSVSADLRVEIGRTSFRVRNPENAPRPWAKPLVEQRTEADTVLRHSDGSIHLLSAIRLAEQCVVCHGTPEKIPGEVAKMLAEKYPNDQATGFAPNDLRGYFWVEVGAQ